MNSAQYWEQRYSDGGSSGPGSYGELAAWKAAQLNYTIAELGARSVIEFGCGDGSQVSLSDYPEYIGIDVSPTAVKLCRKKNRRDGYVFSTEYNGEVADVALSIDVIFHLIEDDVYRDYMRRLQDAAGKWLIVYSSNHSNNDGSARHVKHRSWSDDLDDCFELVDVIRPPAGTFCDLYLYRRLL